MFNEKHNISDLSYSYSGDNIVVKTCYTRSKQMPLTTEIYRICLILCF